MVLQWATKRLCKFFLKRLSKFLHEEIDLEQLDVQLGSGTGQLTDLVLNTDYINEQVKPAPFILKYGSIARIVVKLPCEIELDGLDILVAPRSSDELISHGTGTNVAAFDDVHSGGAFDSCATGNCAYLGVNDGVRMIGQMIKSLLLGLRVKVTKVTVGVEGRTDSHGCLTLQIPQLDYGADDPKDCGDPASIVKTVKFQNASVVIGSDDKPGSSVYDDVCEKDDGRGDSNGLSGSIRISIPCKEGSVTVPKINLELFVNPVQFRVSLDDLQQLLSLAYSFAECKKSAQDESVYHDTSSFHECSTQGQRSVTIETRAADSLTSGKPTLPVIVDWMRKPELTEPDLAASMDEFFECFDAWNQSGSGSGLWNWTCSAFGAASSVSGASSVTYQEVQMEYSISVKTDSVSGTLSYDSVPHEGDGLELQFEQVALTARISQRESSFDAEVKRIDATQLCPSASQEHCGSVMAESLLPRFPVDLYSSPGHDTSRIKLLRITSSLTHPAARLVAKQRQSGIGERTAIHSKISIFLQPLVLWLDVDVVDRLSQSFSRLRVPSSNVATEGLEKVTRSSCKLNVSVPCLRAFLSAANHGNLTHMLALDLVQSVGTSGIPPPILVYEQKDGKAGVHSFISTVTDGSLYLVYGSSCDQIMRLESDSQGKASMEIKYTDNKKVESWVARKMWDAIAAQKNRCDRVEGNNSEFSAAPSESETRSSVVELLKSTSAINVYVSIPKLRLDFSRADDIAFFMLLRSLACFKHEGKDVPSAGLSPVVSQATISFVCREVEAVVDLPCSVQPGTGSKNPSKTYDALQIKVSRLKAISGMALGGDPAAFFLNVQHDDCQVLGLNAKFLPKTQLLSCKDAVIGRGDGGGQNALASGGAGLTVTFMSWPGREQLADVLVTGTMKGTTLLTKGGRFDWVPAFVTFIERCREPFENLSDAEPVEACKRSHFLFDFQDIALCYEPTPEVQLKTDVEAQTISSIACVLAAAAFRVSSSEVAVTQMEQYQIWLRDLALHLVDTGLRKSDLQHYTTKSMQQAGYTQIAKGPVIGALVRIRSGTEGLSWEVECVNNQLYFDTCCDTTAAFGRLVADLQQLFAPDIQKPAELHVRTMKGKSTDDSASELTTSERNCEDGNFDQPSTDGSDGLFEGVVENAFACAKLVHVKKVHDGGNCSSSSRVCDSKKNDATVLFVQTASLTESCEMDESHSRHRQADAPMFIEDYYLMEHGSHASMCSSQESESSRNSGGQDSEPRGGWYVDGPVDVFDSHVPFENSSPKKRSRKTSNSSYPQAVGRVIVTGLTAQWRLYGGSDWAPAEKNRQMGVCMEVLIDGMDLQYDAFAPTGLYASSLLVEIRNLRMYDYSTDAPWRLVLGYYHKKSRPRESTSRAVRIRMDAVRPNPSAPLEEYRLSLALLPICLHLDQRHIDFFQKFFSQPTPPDKEASLPGAADGVDSSAFNAADDAMLPFFQVCEMRPLTVRIDYVPRGIDFGALRGGNVFELLNLVSWKGVELQLKSVHAAGVYGWSSLMGLLFGEWLEDISKNQVHKLVTCCGPIRPLCAVSSGAAKLIVFPAEQYRRDRRLLRGMRKGAVAFLQSISLEALGLGANLAAGAHHILLHTEVALGGSPRSERKDPRRRCQPGDTLEGFQQAYETIANGLERSATSLLGNPVKMYQRGGGAGLAVASAIRASPTAILAPACAAADALRQALLGVRNGLDPERKKESDEKLRGPISDV